MEKKECEHKFSAPVVAPYTYKGGFEDGYITRTSYNIYISCERCGEIKRHTK